MGQLQRASDQAQKYLARVIAWPQPGDQPAYCNIHYTWVPKARDPSKPYPWAGRACRSLEEAVNTVKRASANDNIRDIYVCMSTQRSPGKEKVDKRGRAWYTPMRGQANAVATKTLYVDCDFKGGEHGYDTKEEALQELKRFLEETSLPKPSIVVLSGGGMHIYWSVSRALTLSEWQPLANALAEATKHHNFKCDVGCTVDGARVLRVPGTQNYKQDTPRRCFEGGKAPGRPWCPRSSGR
jgi:hypothetical protein